MTSSITMHDISTQYRQRTFQAAFFFERHIGAVVLGYRYGRREKPRRA